MDQETKVNDTSPQVQEETKIDVVNTPVETHSDEDIQERNWKQFREERKKEREEKKLAEQKAAEKEREAAALKAAMEALLAKPTPAAKAQDPYYDDSDSSEDERINKKVQEALAKEEKKREEAQRDREQREIPQRLEQSYPDFNQVCSQDNLDYFEYHYPEVAVAFKHLPDSFDKWAQIYRAVKRFVPNPNSKKDHNKVEKNLTKPQSMAIGGMTGTGDTAPQDLTDSRRQANWARMQRVMRGTK